VPRRLLGFSGYQERFAPAKRLLPRSAAAARTAEESPGSQAQQSNQNQGYGRQTDDRQDAEHKRAQANEQLLCFVRHRFDLADQPLMLPASSS